MWMLSLVKCLVGRVLWFSEVAEETVVTSVSEETNQALVGDSNTHIRSVQKQHIYTRNR